MGSRLLLALFLATAGFAVPAAAQSQPDPASLPARDSHQGLLVAADPYVSADRYKERFGKRTPLEAGLLALEVHFRNDNDVPIRLNAETIRLMIGPPGGSRQRLAPLTPEEVTERILKRGNRDTTRRRTPLPIPRLPSASSDKEWNELLSVLHSVSLATDLLPPNTTTRGFFYFDIAGHYDWLSNARFYVPDLAFMLDNKALLFFEVDLAPAVR